uniref:Peptidase S1 domain-containing protein n=1 Tax=Nothobranchius furzeri TaxID=105023 RepID=A0A1A8UIK2_NOTFU
MIWLLALVSCFGLICAEEPFRHNDRVIGGSDAEPNTWKTQVSLQFDSSGNRYFSHICGGSVISSFYIMTAAHCILSTDASHYQVVVGEYNLAEYEGSEEFISVTRYIGDWNGDLGNGNDIAILRLATPIYANGYVEIANLPYPDQMLPHGFTCYITGWGSMDHFGNSPDKLQQAPINIVEHAVCSKPEWWGSLALKTMVCAGGDGIISGCHGDSGGPLHCFSDDVWRVHGVVSYGPAGMCNQVSKPTVFTRVSSFIYWMYSVMNEN